MFEKRVQSKAGARVAVRKPGLVEQAMRQRDADLELAVAALRTATEDASAAVHSLLHLVRFKTHKREECEAPAGPAAPYALTLAQQLHQIAYQLRLLESSALRTPGRRSRTECEARRDRHVA
jgi:hypothetical protein